MLTHTLENRTKKGGFTFNFSHKLSNNFEGIIQHCLKRNSIETNFNANWRRH